MHPDDSPDGIEGASVELDDDEDEEDDEEAEVVAFEAGLVTFWGIESGRDDGDAEAEAEATIDPEADSDAEA